MSADASAYADLLASLLAARTDPATARFDAEIAAAEARGSIDGPTARTLRWWQRESLRGIADYLGEVLPELLTHLAAAQSSAAEAVADSAESWSQAASLADEFSSRGEPAYPPDSPASDSAPAAPEPSGAHLRPVEDGAGNAPLPPAPRLLRLGFAPPDTPPQARAGHPDGAPAPRLLVSGLTVASTGDLAPDIIDLTAHDRTAPRPSSHPDDDPSSR
jgi:hypothetical protein